MKMLFQMIYAIKAKFGKFIGFVKTAICTYQQKSRRLRGLRAKANFYTRTGIKWEVYAAMDQLQRARLLRDFSTWEDDL